MSFKILCPGCETRLKLEKQPAKDIKLNCPKCEKAIKVKGTATAAAVKTDADEEEPATAAPAAAKAAPAAAKNAGAKAAAGKKKATKAKPAAASKKKKARSAPADDWDDYEDFGDDFEDDYDDDYGDDDYEEPVRKKKSKGKAAGKATAKGKAKDAKKPAKSGGKGLKIGLAVLLGAAIIGGVAFGISQMGGSDDTSDIPEGAAVAAAGGGDASNAGGGGGDMQSKAGGDDGSPDAAGQNIFNMRYLPKQTEFVAHIKLAEIWASPLAGKYKDKIPAEAMAGAEEFATPEETESITFAVWTPGSGGMAASGLGPIGPAGQQGPGGFGDGMGGPPQDGMGGGFPPMGGGFSPMGGGMTPEIPESSLMVIRVKKSLTASDLGQAKNTMEHKGQKIYEVTQASRGQEQTFHFWLAESQTVVAGQNVDQVKAAIDRGTKEYRFAQFDFVNSNGHVLLAAAPKDPSIFSGMADNKSGDPVLDKLAASLAQGMKAVCLSINVTADVGLNIQFDCKNGTNAATIQQDLAAGLELGKTKLSEAMKAMGVLGGMALRPVEGILNRSQASASGEQVTVSMDIKDGDITALSNSAGLIMGMAMGMGGGSGGGGGMPPGMSMSDGGFPGGGFPSGGNDVPFGSATEKSVDYSEDIALTFKYRCARCHSADNAKGGLSLASYESVMAFSSDAGKAVTPNDPEASTVFKVVSQGGAPHEKLKDDEVDKIRGWIEAGAPPPGTKASFTASSAGGDKDAEMSDADGAGGEKMMAALSYAKDIAPIAQKYCANCHINQKRGNFSMASLSDIMSHSSIKSGKAVQPGNAFTSSLYSLVASGSMPKGPRKVPKAEADMIMKWISEGAKP